MSEWQPIETAPKDDDSTILLLSGGHLEDYDTRISVAFWGHVDGWAESDHRDWCNWWAGTNDDDIWEVVRNPTHWMPLPAPPITYDTLKDLLVHPLLSK